MLDLAFLLAGKELSCWDGCQGPPGEAEGLRRHPNAATARSNWGGAERVKGPLAARTYSQALRLPRTLDCIHKTPPVTGQTYVRIDGAC